MSESKCNRCSKLYEVVNDTTSRCREWDIQGGSVVMERFFERCTEGCQAYRKKADEKAISIERGLALSDGFFDNARRWKGRRKKDAENNIQ